eukprot:jgi/Tetstr1/445777/TSEL_033424.t1
MAGPTGVREKEVLDAIAASRRRASAPGEFLDGATSLAVYSAAGRAFRCCAACGELENVCLRPGTEERFWELFDAAHPADPGEKGGPVLSLPLLRFVHAVVNQQKRVSEAWRARAAHSLADVPGLSELGEAEAQSALQEVAQLSAASVLASSFFEMSGLEDTWKPGAAQPPTEAPPCRSLGELLLSPPTKEGMFQTWIPSLSKPAMNPTAVTQEVADAYAYLYASLPGGGPLRVWSSNPRACLGAVELVKSLYLPLGDVSRIFQAPPANRALSRVQIEVVAVALTEILKPGRAAGEEALGAFGQAAAKSPRHVEGRAAEAARRRQALEEALGREAVVDAAATAAAFHLITRGVDTAGHFQVAITAMGYLSALFRLKNAAFNGGRRLLSWALGWEM